MLITILKHELQNLAADKALWLIVTISLLIFSYAICNGVTQTYFYQTTIDKALLDETERIDKLKEKVADIEKNKTTVSPFTDPRNASRVGANLGVRYALMPPNALNFLSLGQSDLYPHYVKVSTRSKQTFLENEEIENPNNLLTGKFDLSFVVIYLYPLLILALSYNIISAEKEQGTLALILSQPVNLKTLISGKILALISLIGSIILFFTIFIALLANNNNNFARVLFWILTILLYGSFWFGLAILVNVSKTNSVTNAIILLSCWVIFVVILPFVINMLATTLYPVPSRVGLIQAMREASNEANAKASNLLAKYYVDHPELAAGKDPDLNDFAIKSFVVQDEVEKSVQDILTHFDQQLIKQQKLVNKLGFLSPAIICQDALNSIAGTGLDRYQHFLNQVDVFHKKWQDFFLPKIFQKQLLTIADYEKLPQFTFVEEPIIVIAERLSIKFLGLIFPITIIFLFVIRKLRNYSLVEH